MFAWNLDFCPKVFGNNTFPELSSSLSSEMKSNPNGIDPRQIFQLGTLNVVSHFTLGKQYDLADPEFKERTHWLKNRKLRNFL